MSIKITDIIVKDIRFPTSKSLEGSDAMNHAPNYSAEYVILQTYESPNGQIWQSDTFSKEF